MNDWARVAVSSLLALLARLLSQSCLGQRQVNLLLLALLLHPGLSWAAARPSIDLNGTWQFRLDPRGEGEAGRWHSKEVSFPESIQVPGCWQAQGFGERSGILRHHYAGEAWYRRTVMVPADWQGKLVSLRIGGVLRRASVFVNGTLLGEHDGFSAPFQVDITKGVRFGADNVIAVRVANPGQSSGESPDKQTPSVPTGMLNYIGNWGGIYGKVELEARERNWIEETYITSDAWKVVRFRIGVQSRETGNSSEATVKVVVSRGREERTYQQTVNFRFQPGQKTSVELEVPVPDAQLWTPDSPSLYTASIALMCGNRECDHVEERFGIRQITTEGNALLLNGKPLYLRGFGDDNIEVLTGVPPASKEVYRKRLELAKDFGFNAVRFHSMTPVREFFEAADEVGLLIMAELPVAYTQYLLPHKDLLRNELRQILLAHRNHPSFLSLALGNEFNLNWLKTEAERKEFLDTVAEFYRLAKSIDPTRLVLSNDGYLMRPTDMASLFRDFPKDLPTVRHEFGSYYCSLPDVSLLEKFNGVLVPTWLETKKQWVEDQRLSAVYPLYLRNSQRLQQLGRKYQIERARLNPDVTGYHYWLIVDFPGGTGEGDSWEEGWFDYFWQPKGILPQEGKEINSAVLSMISAGVSDRTFWSDTAKRVDVLVSNYGDQAIQNGSLKWRLRSSSRVVAESTVRDIKAPLGKVTQVATLQIGELKSKEPEKLELALELNNGGTTQTSRWHFWAFPRGELLQSANVPVVSRVKWAGLSRLYPFVQQAVPELASEALLITSTLNSDAMQLLESGGKVWLLADQGQFERPGDTTFFPASGGALGTLIPDHPALRRFPQEGFCDLQFFNLLEGAYSFSLDDWPKDLVPIVGGIRTTTAFLSKSKNMSRVGYLFEARVGQGKLLASTLRLRENLDEAYPEAIFLFDCLLRYAVGSDFKPPVQIEPRLLDRWLVR
jgi:beta-galactosidase